MQSSKHTQKSIDYNLELKKQKDIQQSHNDITTCSIIEYNIKKCTHIKNYHNFNNKFILNGDEFISKLYTNGLIENKSIVSNYNKNSPVYAVTYKFAYAGKEHTVVDSIYTDKNMAAKNIEKSEHDKIHFKFTKNNYIYLYDYPEITKFRKLKRIFLPSLISTSILALLYYSVLSIITSPDLTLGIFETSIVIFMTLFILTMLYKLYMTDVSDRLYLINSEKNVIDKERTDNYKSIIATYTIDENGLCITAKNMDYKWYFKRDEYGKLSKEGMEFINKISDSKECAITIKNSGSEKSNWKSSNGDWWIIESSL